MNSIVFMQDNLKFVTAARDNSIKLWDIRKFQGLDKALPIMEYN